MCGLETESYSPSSSSGPAEGGPSSPSCFCSSSCKTRRGSVPGTTGRFTQALSLGCLTLGKRGHTDTWAHSQERCPIAAWGPEVSDPLSEVGQRWAQCGGERKELPRASLATHDTGACHRRLAFELVPEECVGATVNSGWKLYDISANAIWPR